MGLGAAVVHSIVPIFPRSRPPAPRLSLSLFPLFHSWRRSLFTTLARSLPFPLSVPSTVSVYLLALGPALPALRLSSLAPSLTCPRQSIPQRGRGGLRVLKRSARGNSETRFSKPAKDRPVAARQRSPRSNSES